jgi:hypothetical protein
MKRYSYYFLILLAIMPVQARAQQNDFQLWPSAQLNLEVINNLKIHIEEEIRLRENSSLLSRQINDIGMSYRLNKFLKAGVFYRLEADWKNADEYVWRNGVYGEIALRYRINRLTLGYRLRVQSSKVEMNSREEALFDGFRHRHKLSAEYDIKGIPLVPFLESELFVNYSSNDPSEIKGLRTWIGLDYTIMKIHTLSVKYGIDCELNTKDPLRAYIIALGYALDLSLRSPE